MGQLGATVLSPLLTVDEVAALLHLAPKSIRKLARAGGIPHVKVMGRFRFDRDEIQRWLQEHHSDGERHSA